MTIKSAQVVLWLLQQTSPGSKGGFQLRNWKQLVSRKKIESIVFGFYSIHSSAASLMRKRTDPSVHTYASKGGRVIDSWRI